uniref:Uncharacterized protein n=2 Tax=unclassified Jerseyvirus TaxID=2025810 RepID=A0AAU8GEY3_9CAUD
MITKEQATYLMGLVDSIDDASAAMAHTAGRDHEEHVAASMAWDLAYHELRAFIGAITDETE